jgi:hypothetical protein
MAVDRHASSPPLPPLSPPKDDRTDSLDDDLELDLDLDLPTDEQGPLLEGLLHEGARRGSTESAEEEDDGLFRRRGGGVGAGIANMSVRRDYGELSSRPHAFPLERHPRRRHHRCVDTVVALQAEER